MLIVFHFPRLTLEDAKLVADAVFRALIRTVESFLVGFLFVESGHVDVTVEVFAVQGMWNIDELVEVTVPVPIHELDADLGF